MSLSTEIHLAKGLSIYVNERITAESLIEVAIGLICRLFPTWRVVQSLANPAAFENAVLAWGI
jgi:hypothetical protein